MRDESRRYKPVQPSVAAQFTALANRQNCLTTRPGGDFARWIAPLQTVV